eukprot:gnl/TRDRNA2_/TRDRNA2_123318_c0_seq1.p1 gnl/TRDRNA2_/TRDRNA2_123318_c0~~gnl/TRDRNA2_/TRDRNA2_123318_c0_seq1.p1  ORF type:complete len:696 (-),score=48.38 gnl/TRDRNA2_/TRDRNA2_123318_c0_seq1:241-2205(-)
MLNSANDTVGVQEAVGEVLLISAVLRIFSTSLLWRYQEPVLLSFGNANALSFAAQYSTGRLPGELAESINLVGFATLRGVRDTVTPLYISLASNLVNVVLDPIFMFTAKMGIFGAGLATSASQIFAAAVYLPVLLQQRLVRWATIFKIPSWASLKRTATSAGTLQLHAVAQNFASITVTKVVQGLDQTGTAAAAHVVTIQLFQLCSIILHAVSKVPSIIIPSELNTKGTQGAREVASRLLCWGVILGTVMGCIQLLAVPLLRVFTPLPEVRSAAVLPSIIAAVLQLINGVTVIGENIMIGTQSFGVLALGQVLATATIIVGLHFAPATLAAVWFCFLLSTGVRFLNVMLHHFVNGPLAQRRPWLSQPRGPLADAPLAANATSEPATSKTLRDLKLASPSQLPSSSVDGKVQVYRDGTKVAKLRDGSLMFEFPNKETAKTTETSFDSGTESESFLRFARARFAAVKRRLMLSHFLKGSSVRRKSWFRRHGGGPRSMRRHKRGTFHKPRSSFLESRSSSVAANTTIEFATAPRQGSRPKSPAPASLDRKVHVYRDGTRVVQLRDGSLMFEFPTEGAAQATERSVAPNGSFVSFLHSAGAQLAHAIMHRFLKAPCARRKSRFRRRSRVPRSIHQKRSFFQKLWNPFCESATAINTTS